MKLIDTKLYDTFIK